MPIFAWVKNAFVNGNFLLDHTWVTSYDLRKASYADVGDVIGAKQHYWYCKGDFWKTSRLADPILSCVKVSAGASCLVIPNNNKTSGTVHVYGVDGVCHQVANQVLYVTKDKRQGKPLTVRVARGYTLSSLLFGTYGRREDEWDQARDRCGVRLSKVSRRSGVHSLLIRRMSYCLKVSTNDNLVKKLEQRRRGLLNELDSIAFREQIRGETAEERVEELNSAINRFLRDAETEEYSLNDDHLYRVLGILRKQEAFVIDHKLFKFPKPEDRPVRNAALGW